MTCKKKENFQQEETDSDSEESQEMQNNGFKKRETPRYLLDLGVRTDSLVKEYNGNPFDKYVELDVLGEGAYGVVKKVCLKDNPDTIRAMKIISQENIAEGQRHTLLEEIKILKTLEHPNIMKIYEYFNDNNNVYIVSELCDEGDLLGKINKVGTMSELVVKYLMGQILNALSYLHENRVFHGDIKLENIMLYKSLKKGRRFTKINKLLNSSFKLQEDIEKSYENDESSKDFLEDVINYEVKLIDFGCSRFLTKKKHNKLSGIVGTSIYCSPEVINNKYDERSDEWSCGVLMYILLCGEPPFQGETEEEIFDEVKKGYVDFSKRQFNNVSRNCIDLIKQLLTYNKKNRIKASDALNHKFFTENFNPMTAMTQNKDLNILKKLLSLEKFPSKLHEVVIAYCCFNFINKEEEKHLRQLFRYMDHDNKNKLSIQDFKRGFQEANIMVTNNELKKIMNILDSDKSNLIEYQEFLRATCDKKLLFRDENLKVLFSVIDKNKKGYATKEDIELFVFGAQRHKVNRNIISGFNEQIGMKKDSKLTYEQFCELIRNNKGINKLSDIKENFLRNYNLKINNNFLSCKDLITKIEGDILYNMTEGDIIIEEQPHNNKYNKKANNS